MPRYEDLDPDSQAFFRNFRCREDGPPEWTPLSKPLSECKIALVTTSGLIRKSDKPFDIGNTAGDSNTPPSCETSRRISKPYGSTQVTEPESSCRSNSRYTIRFSCHSQSGACCSQATIAAYRKMACVRSRMRCTTISIRLSRWWTVGWISIAGSGMLTVRMRRSPFPARRTFLFWKID